MPFHSGSRSLLDRSTRCLGDLRPGLDLSGLGLSRLSLKERLFAAPAVNLSRNSLTGPSLQWLVLCRSLSLVDNQGQPRTTLCQSSPPAPSNTQIYEATLGKSLAMFPAPTNIDIAYTYSVDHSPMTNFSEILIGLEKRL